MKEGIPPEADYPLITLSWVFWLSWFGAISAYLIKVMHAGLPWSITRLLAECVVSSFVGFVTFLFCDWQAFDPRLTAINIAVSAHFSTRAIFLFRNRFLSDKGDDNGA